MEVGLKDRERHEHSRRDQVNETYHPERLLVPLVTPFDAAGRVDEEALASHGDALLAAGAAGLVALATTGEASSLDDDERALVVGVCTRVCAWMSLSEPAVCGSLSTVSFCVNFASPKMSVTV